TDYTTSYRWEWFSRARWQEGFRHAKKASSGGFVELVKERGLDRELVLDSSCGLGLKTIVMEEAGINVEGSDACALAVEYARLLAEEEGHRDIRYFQSTWEALPRTTEKRYAALFNDALSWVYSEEEMVASLKGLHDVLKPGGILAYMGALPGSDENTSALLYNGEWSKMLSEAGRYSLGFRFSDGHRCVTQAVVLEKGTDYVDRHLLYIIEDGKKRCRLEARTERHPLKWHWPRMEQHLVRAGFCEFTTKEFIADSGKP
ncbi:unnamed protein product, partial [marine sediment metagenome]